MGAPRHDHAGAFFLLKFRKGIFFACITPERIVFQWPPTTIPGCGQQKYWCTKEKTTSSAVGKRWKTSCAIRWKWSWRRRFWCKFDFCKEASRQRASGQQARYVLANLHFAYLLFITCNCQLKTCRLPTDSLLFPEKNTDRHAGKVEIFAQLVL